MSTTINLYHGDCFDVLPLIPDHSVNLILCDLPYGRTRNEWLIRTYTNPGDTVLDNCMGSGTTGIAAVNTERHFIGIEKRQETYELAKARIHAAQEVINEQ